MQIRFQNSATTAGRKTLAVSHSDDFTTDYFQRLFSQKYRIRTDNLAVTLLPFF